ncbi:MAG: FecR domain-containing protein [Gammaproteobacteria bacterium]|nr:FecR domain-containing protein [Gammaproteobacteria bacterium]
MGRATVVLGQVEAIAADGDSRSLQRRDSVFEGDTLRSAAGGRAQFRFTDGGQVSLRPDSEFRIQDYEHDQATPATSRQQLDLRRGGFRARTGSIAERNRAGYRVQTPIGAIGIRGTIFDVHQEPGGPLYLGSSQGTIEVETISGEVGRVGEGESYDFLRVNVDGSIDYLLEAPDAFTGAPDIGAPGDSEADGVDAGSVAEASVATGVGAAESTAGIETPALTLLRRLDHPALTGRIAPADVGDGVPPFIEPEPTPEPDPAPEAEPVLDQDTIALLLDDDRIGLALGVQGADIADDGSLLPGPSGLFGGIATVNLPIFALDTSRSGFAPGVTGADRQALLEQAGAILFADSGDVTFEENVFDVPGLVWGRFQAPVAVFVDPSDRSRVLELQRDILFALGSPADLAELEGTFDYELVEFDALSSGLPVADMSASGTLDLGSGTFAGVLDVLFDNGESGGDLNLFAAFESAVEAGVLAAVVFDVLELRDVDAESAFEAEGDLAGFFTGDGATFLQLGFDFRVPSRNDADVEGLALLQQLDEVLEGISDEEAAALTEGFAYVGVTCCFEEEGVEPSGLLLGLAGDPRETEADTALLGIALDAEGRPAGVTDSGLLSFPPALVLRRGDATTERYADFFEVLGTESLAAFRLEAGDAPLEAFDVASGDFDRVLGDALLAITGVPTPTENLTGWRRYQFIELVDAFGIERSGEFTVTDIEQPDMSFNVNFADGSITQGRFSVPFRTERTLSDDQTDTEFFFLFADFEGQLGSGDSLPFAEMRITDGLFGLDDVPGGDPIDLERSVIGGFFTGDDGEAFATTFHIENAPDPDGAVFEEGILLLGGVLLGPVALDLRANDEAALAESTLLFVGAACCSADQVFAGRAADSGVSFLAVNADGDGTPLRAGDAGFFDLQPEQLLRAAGDQFISDSAFGFTFLANFPDSDTRRTTWGLRNAPLRVDADTGDILQEITDDFFFVTATPTPLSILEAEGFSTFAGTGLQSGGFVRTSNSNVGGGSAGAASFNVDLASGEVFAGHLFIENTDLTQDLDGPLDVELGWELFFEGQVILNEDGSFIEFDLIDGVYAGSVPLDLEQSHIEGFFAGESGQGLRFSAAFNLSTVVDEDSGEAAAVGGVFGITNNIDEELRLAPEDVATWFRIGPGDIRRPGFGIAAFSPGFSGSTPPGRGLLLGRSGPAEENQDYVLGANPLALFEEGERVADTRRVDFFAQPFDFILRQGTASDVEDAYIDDVRPDGGPDFDGFEVSWGAWRDAGSGGQAEIQPNPGNSGVVTGVDGQVHFASVNPTPQSQLPRQGTFSYGGDAAFVGSAHGDFSGSIQFPTDVDELTVSFLLDFGSGDISEGAISVGYGAEPAMDWSGTFEGHLHAAVTDLQLNSLELSEFGDSVGAADLDRSQLTGLLTGPEGERHAGGFSFVFDDGELFESVRGLWVVDQVPQ